MQFIHTDKTVKEQRRSLRNNPTPQEVVLWKYLRSRNFGVKFRRQHSIGPYIVDFYCAEKKVVIELDGNQHLEKETQKYDQERTSFLQHQNYRVLRFWNSEIDSNIQAVLETIKSACGFPPLSLGGLRSECVELRKGAVQKRKSPALREAGELCGSREDSCLSADQVRRLARPFPPTLVRHYMTVDPDWPAASVYDLARVDPVIGPFRTVRVVRNRRDAWMRFSHAFSLKEPTRSICLIAQEVNKNRRGVSAVC